MSAKIQFVVPKLPPPRGFLIFSAKGDWKTGSAQEGASGSWWRVKSASAGSAGKEKKRERNSLSSHDSLRPSSIINYYNFLLSRGRLRMRQVPKCDMVHHLNCCQSTLDMFIVIMLKTNRWKVSYYALQQLSFFIKLLGKKFCNATRVTVQFISYRVGGWVEQKVTLGIILKRWKRFGDILLAVPAPLHLVYSLGRCNRQGQITHLVCWLTCNIDILCSANRSCL